MSWSARLLIGLVLIIVGGAAATWGLAHYQPAAKFLGVSPAAGPETLTTPKPIVPNPEAATPPAVQPQADRIAYLEPLLVDRFGAQHPSAVATIVTASHQPIRLNDLIAEYEKIGPDLRRGGSQESWWAGIRREFGSLVEIHQADRPAANPDARYSRALQRLSTGDVDQALAETMRLPGAASAGDWVAKARRYVASHRALDEIESAALLGGPNRTS
jgi:hypothetical protein